jgi:hypothetical protein
MTRTFTISVITAIMVMVICAGCISPPQPVMNNLTDKDSNTSLMENDTGIYTNASQNWTNWTYTNGSMNGPLAILVMSEATSHTNMTAGYYFGGAGGGGGCPASGCGEPFNFTACNEDAKKFGENCTCIICGIWAGYDTQGFYNQSGLYYSDGTPTGMTFQQMERIEETLANYRYNRYMNEKGYYYDGNKWHGNGL